jgi:glycosyltransferase involved in cell wall biosynthesis
MRIAHVIAPARFGGAERVVEALAVGQQRSGYDVRVALLVDPALPESSLSAALRTREIETIEIAYPARSFRAQRRALESHLVGGGFDVLHSHGYLADMLLASLRAGIGRVRVSTLHGFTGGDWRVRCYELLQLVSLRRFDAVVPVSRVLADRLDVAVGAGRTAPLILNAWPGDMELMERDAARKLLGVRRDSLSLGWVGRISQEKGLDVMIEALPMLLDIPLQLTVIGIGSEERAVRARAREIGVDHSITWFGEAAAASRLFSAFDAFVISSRTEGTPITLFEAMAANVPVVATVVGGIPDVVSENEATLVPPCDPAALASGIRKVFSDRSAAVRRAARARRRLESDFAAPAWIGRYDALYRRVLNEHPGR